MLWDARGTPAASCPRVCFWGQDTTCKARRVLLPSRGTWAGWRSNPRPQHVLGSSQLGGDPAGKDLGGLVDTNVSMSQACVLMTKVASGVLGCVRSVASTSR